MKKVIRLTESDLEKIIRRVVSEQRFVDIPGKTPQQGTQTFDFGEVFPSAQYKIQNTSALKQKVDGIKSFLSKYPEDQQFTLKINAGESRVPNPKGFEEEGSLARARANELKNILQKELQGVVDFEFESPEIAIGTTEWDPNLGKDYSGYTKEQFVKLNVNASGKKPAPRKKIVPYPLFAGSVEPYNAGGVRHLYIGFTDGSAYRFNWNTPYVKTKEEAARQVELIDYLKKKVGSGVFNDWLKRRNELYRICADHMGTWCDKVPSPDEKDMIHVTDEKIADQLAAKIRNERLEFPTSDEGKEIRVFGASQPKHYGEQ